VSVLGDAVEARVPTTRLAQLTNINSASAATVNDTVLELAVTDTEAAFKTYAQLDFDETDARHISVGVYGVLAILEANKGQDPDEKRLAAWRDRCFELARTTSRKRISPLVPAGLPPRVFANNRPVFDPPRFADGQPALPPDGGERGS